MDIANLCIWSGVSWMMFCRAIKLDQQTRWLVTLSVSGLGAISAAQAIAPFVPTWDHNVRALDLLLGLVLFAFFGAFSTLWDRGVPAECQREESGRATR